MHVLGNHLGAVSSNNGVINTMGGKKNGYTEMSLTFLKYYIPEPVSCLVQINSQI